MLSPYCTTHNYVHDCNIRLYPNFLKLSVQKNGLLRGFNDFQRSIDENIYELSIFLAPIRPVVVFTLAAYRKNGWDAGAANASLKPRLRGYGGYAGAAKKTKECGMPFISRLKSRVFPACNKVYLL